MKGLVSALGRRPPSRRGSILVSDISDSPVNIFANCSLSTCIHRRRPTIPNVFLQDVRLYWSTVHLSWQLDQTRGPSLREPSGFAIQSRVCLETIQKDGSILPSSGTLTAYEAPNGPGVRTDGFGYMGYQTSTAFDSLLAKVIVHYKSPSFGEAARKAERALSEFK